MKFRLSHIVRNLALVSPILILWSCANIVKPSGGERDQQGPEIIGVIPAPQTLNYQGNRIDFYFDEFIKPGNYSKDIFISPISETPPLVTIKNRRLRIEFQEELRDSTTYVITLGTGIKDFNENNQMDESFTYAFSTGDQLDSMQISGTVKNAWTGDRQGKINVFLFPADEIEGNDIFEKKPVYATETDENGAFKFEYLRNAAYKIYAVGDQDKSYSFNSEVEMLGLAENPLIDLTDTNQVGVPVELFAFFLDEREPVVRSLKWVNDHTMHLELSEPLRPIYGTDSLSFVLSDTLGGNPREITTYRYRHKDRSHVYLHTPEPRSIPLDLQIQNLMDTLGNWDDTLVRIDPENFSREEKGRIFDPPILQFEQDRILLNSYFVLPSDLDTSNIQLVDTNGVVFDMDLEASGFELRAILSTFPEPGMPYLFRIKPGIDMPGSAATDTLLEFPMVFPSIDEFGSISGKIVPDSTRPDAKWVVLIMQSTKGSSGSRSKAATADIDDDGNNTPTTSSGRGGRGGKGGGSGGGSSSAKGGGSSSGGGTKGGPGEIVLKRFTHADAYQLFRIKAGTYKVKFIKDDDENGYFTPGSLNPYRIPEKTAVDPSSIEIRVKWEVEGYNLFPTLELETPDKETSSKRG